MIYFYNTLSLKKESFKPLVKGEVKIYSCGPTVYDYPHIGNMRAYIFADVLRRLFEYHNYKVIHVINITDVGHLLVEDGGVNQDKIERSARRQRKTVKEIVEFYTQAFLRYLRLLHIKKPTYLPFASSHIQEQIAIIKALEEKGFTYLTEEGVYFDTSKLKKYGRFGGIDLSKENISRLKRSSFKKNASDFALWRFSKRSEKRQQEWPSPWGIGFPGWHSECLAMNRKYLGLPFDIHTGGVDHIATHHQNEIAQAEAVFGINPARYWLHSEFVLVNGEKMSKSRKNFITLDDIIKEGYEPLSLRYLYLQAHYRQKINFTFEALKAAQKSLYNLYRFIRKLSFIEEASKKINKKTKFTSATTTNQLINQIEHSFKSALNDDLNTAKALAVIFNFISTIEQKLTKEDILFDEVSQAKELIFKIDQVLGLVDEKKIFYKLPSEVEKLIQEREKYRCQKNYKKADEIRNYLKKVGWQIEDTKYGQFVFILH